MQLHKLHEKQILKEDSGTLEGLLFGDNILGQLASFGTSFLKGGLAYAQKLKKMTYDKIKANLEMDEAERMKLLKEKEEKKKIRLKSAFFFFANNSARIEVLRDD